MSTKQLAEISPVFLTFDDGPHPGFTPALLALLAEAGVRASFFVLGEACERHPELLLEIQRAGHTLGNHSYSHRDPRRLSEPDAREEVRRTSEIIAGLSGEAPRYFRPPYGRCRDCMLDEAARLGMETVLWDRSAIDWGLLGRPRGIGRRLGRAEAGEVVLCHDAPRIKNHPEHTLAVLPGFLRESRKRGLRFAALGTVGANTGAGSRSLSRLQSV